MKEVRVHKINKSSICGLSPADFCCFPSLLITCVSLSLSLTLSPQRIIRPLAVRTSSWILFCTPFNYQSIIPMLKPTKIEVKVCRHPTQLKLLPCPCSFSRKCRTLEKTVPRSSDWTTLLHTGLKNEYSWKCVKKSLACYQIPTANPHIYIITSLFILTPHCFVCFTPNIGLHLSFYYRIHIVCNIYTDVITVHYALYKTRSYVITNL